MPSCFCVQSSQPRQLSPWKRLHPARSSQRGSLCSPGILECRWIELQYDCVPASEFEGVGESRRPGNGIMDIVDRVKAILLTPKSEWLVIERESGDHTYLFTNYVAILAAIPAVCGFVGESIIRSLAAIGTVRVGIVFGIAFAIVNYLLAFVMVYVIGLIINALAPTFNGQKNQPNALKLA